MNAVEAAACVCKGGLRDEVACGCSNSVEAGVAVACDACTCGCYAIEGSALVSTRNCLVNADEEVVATIGVAAGEIDSHRLTCSVECTFIDDGSTFCAIVSVECGLVHFFQEDLELCISPAFSSGRRQIEGHLRDGGINHGGQLIGRNDEFALVECVTIKTIHRYVGASCCAIFVHGQGLLCCCS